jgi:tetratricopeptide (TPR) repeat protein/predicted aspartyl protease
MQQRVKVLRQVCAGLMSMAAALFASASAFAAGCSVTVLANLPVTVEGARLSVPVTVNGQKTKFWLDSGAYYGMMPLTKAKELGLTLEPPARFGMAMEGIGGIVFVDVTTIKSFVIAGQDIPNRAFLVGGSDVGSALIGSDTLGLADTEFDLADGLVKIAESHGCEHTAMNYWAVGKPYFTVPLMSPQAADHEFKLPVSINGKRIQAEFDTGAETSVISRSTALRIGLDLSAPGVVADEGGSGIGGHHVRGWVVPIAEIDIGEERILNTHIEVMDDDYNGGGFFDMLLGEDYIMAHHIYVARHPHMIFFTYSGGQPFHTSLDLHRVARADAKPDLPAAHFVPPPETRRVEAVTNEGSEPRTAEAFSRRGAARLDTGNVGGALSDLNEAIRQSPATADFYVTRAKIYREMGNPTQSRGDLDKALALDGSNFEVLRMRAEARLAAKDRDGALADVEAAARVTRPISLESARLADLFVQLHQPARAIPMLDTVIAAHRDDSSFYYLLNARCFARALANVDLDLALADCNRAIREGARADWLDSRGLVYFRKGSFAAAISDYDAALKTNPRQVWSLFMRGLAKIALGQADAGKADQVAARAIEPDISDEVAAYGIDTKGAKAP